MNALHRWLAKAAVLLLLLFPLAAKAENPEPKALVRVRVFNVPRETADALMAEKDFLSNLNGSLAKLSALVEKNEAVIVANPSIQTTTGPHSVQVQGLVSLNFTLKPESTIPLGISIEVTSSGQLLRTFTPVTRGQPIFLGSFDPPNTASDAPPGTNLVFLVVQ